MGIGGSEWTRRACAPRRGRRNCGVTGRYPADVTRRDLRAHGRAMSALRPATAQAVTRSGLPARVSPVTRGARCGRLYPRGLRAAARDTRHTDAPAYLPARASRNDLAMSMGLPISIEREPYSDCFVGNDFGSGRSAWRAQSVTPHTGPRFAVTPPPPRCHKITARLSTLSSLPPPCASALTAPAYRERGHAILLLLRPPCRLSAAMDTYLAAAKPRAPPLIKRSSASVGLAMPRWRRMVLLSLALVASLNLYPPPLPNLRLPPFADGVRCSRQASARQHPAAAGVVHHTGAVREGGACAVTSEDGARASSPYTCGGARMR